MRHANLSVEVQSCRSLKPELKEKATMSVAFFYIRRTIRRWHLHNNHRHWYWLKVYQTGQQNTTFR